MIVSEDVQMNDGELLEENVPEFDPDEPPDLFGDPIEYISEHPGDERVMGLIKKNPDVSAWIRCHVFLQIVY